MSNNGVSLDSILFGLFTIAGVAGGMMLLFCSGARYIEKETDKKLKSVGIERIDSCEIRVDGSTVSNWCEIVWLDKGKNGNNTERGGK